MLVFIDESGCAGFKLARGSSPYFVAVMVIFSDHAQADRADGAIEQARAAVGHKGEFKFSKSRDEVRDSFFEHVMPYEFVVRAIVVDKAALYSPHLRESTESFYNYFVQLMMRHDGRALRDAIVKIDGSGDRRFKDELGRYLRGQLGSRKIKKIRFVDSHRNNLVQLADMAAGAIHRKYRRDRGDGDRWFNALRRRIEDVWTFPNPGH